MILSKASISHAKYTVVYCDHKLTYAYTHLFLIMRFILNFISSITYTNYTHHEMTNSSFTNYAWPNSTYFPPSCFPSYTFANHLSSDSFKLLGNRKIIHYKREKDGANWTCLSLLLHSGHWPFLYAPTLRGISKTNFIVLQTRFGLAQLLGNEEIGK